MFVFSIVNEPKNVGVKVELKAADVVGAMADERKRSLEECELKVARKLDALLCEINAVAIDFAKSERIPANKRKKRMQQTIEKRRKVKWHIDRLHSFVWIFKCLLLIFFSFKQPLYTSKLT